MDLLCNSYPVENNTKDEKKTTVNGNGNILAVTHKAILTGYKQDAWFRTDAINNTIDIKNFLKQHQVTYDSINKIFVVHREDQKK